MTQLYKEWRIASHLDKYGPKTFTELVNSEELNLARNTINKYLRILREKNWVNAKYEGDRKLNFLTTDGKIELEKKFGKDDIKHRLQAYYLYEQKIKEYRDGFLSRLNSELPNQLMIDCIEYFVEFEGYNFANKLPSKDFQYYLAYFLARYEIHYCKSRDWLKVQPHVMQLSQKEFFKTYNIDQIEIEYFCREWAKIKYAWPIFDKDDNMWFLSSKSLFYEVLMLGITLRTRRGTLQELIFDNFIFNASEEAVYILTDAIQNLQLNPDFIQNRQILRFIERMMNIFLEGKKGYKTVWLNLPNDRKSLEILSIELETDLNQIDKESPQHLEIIRTLFEINLKLNNHEEAFIWGEKHMELNPRDFNLPIKLESEYFYSKKYDKFLNIANNLINENPFDILSRLNLIKYYVDVDVNLEKAFELANELDNLLLDQPNLVSFYGTVEFYKAKIYFMKESFDYARLYAERAWYEYLIHSDELFVLLSEIYENSEDWESLEDFCVKAYTENRFSPPIFIKLYYSHLKRKSFKKAEQILKYVSHYYPEYERELRDIQ